MKVNLGKYPGPKSKKERKVSICIDPWDTWSLDHTLAKIILPCLIQLRDTTHGYPSTFYIEGDNSDVGFEQWKETLNKMIWSLQQIVDDDDYLDKLLPGVDGAIPDYSLYRAHQEKIQLGLKLFGEYFQALWD